MGNRSTGRCKLWGDRCCYESPFEMALIDNEDRINGGRFTVQRDCTLLQTSGLSHVDVATRGSEEMWGWRTKELRLARR